MDATSTAGYRTSSAFSVSYMFSQHLQSTLAKPGGGSVVSTTEDWKRDPFLSGGVIAVLVLGTLCLILGVIYGYIYFTRINPRSNRIRKYIEQSTQMEDGAQTTSTHLFLFKKS